MTLSKLRRNVATALAATLVIGFMYSGVAVLRGYRELFRAAQASGPAATIDPYMAPMSLRSGQDLRDAVARAGWGPDEDVALVAEASALSAEDMVQAHFAASYLLFPRRVWLAPWCDRQASQTQCDALHASADPLAEPSRHDARYAILVGRSNPFPHASGRQVSDMMRLVSLR
jgi:hypothetical protein